MGQADELIALRIETTADLTGVRAVRSETAGLTAAVKASADETAASNQRVTLSQEQARKAAAEAGGDFTKLQEILRRMVAEENNLAAATSKTTTELQRQASGTSTSRPTLQGPTGPQLGPALPGTPIGGGVSRANALAELAAYRMEADRTKVSVDKVPGSARTAANAVGMLSQAALSGQGSMAGMATAAGGLATGISMISGSAAVAASAAGIGALITIAVIAAEVLSKLTATAKNTQVTMDHIGGFSTRQLSAASAELAGIEAQLGAAQKKAADASKYDITNIAGTGKDILSRGAIAAQQELDNLLERRNALQKKIGELSKTDIQETRDRTLAGIVIVAAAQQTAVGRYRGQLAVIESDRLEAIRSRSLTEEAANTRAATQRRALAKQGEDYLDGLAEANAAHIDALTTTSFQARINAADRAAAKEKEDLKDRALSATDEIAAVTQIELRRKGLVTLAERERDTALATSVARRQSESEDPREVQQGKLALIDQEYLADVKLLGAKEALLNADQKRAKLARDMVQQGLAGYGLLSTAVKNHGTVVGAVAKAGADAVRLYEIYEKGKSAAISAQIQFADATAAFAVGNFAGGALHLAAAGGYAAAAVAAGAEALGGGASGGGSSGGSDANGGYGTFQPTNSNGGGSQTLIFQMVNPASGEVLNETAYQLNRGGLLKRPIRPGNFGGLLVATMG